MDNKDSLRSMLNNLINDRHEEATMDLHSYLTDKMKSAAGFSAPAQEAEASQNDVDPLDNGATE